MQKLIHSIKTLSPPSLNLFSKPSSATSPRFRSQVFVACFRSYKSASSTGDFIKTPMASSATGKLPSQPIQDGLGNKFWTTYTKEWTQALYSPFVVSLAAGNLKLDTFRDYIAQDVFFLKAYAKALVILTVAPVFSFICISIFGFLCSFFLKKNIGTMFFYSYKTLYVWNVLYQLCFKCGSRSSIGVASYVDTSRNSEYPYEHGLHRKIFVILVHLFAIVSVWVSLVYCSGDDDS